jgi:copper chaperone CopZ
MLEKRQIKKIDLDTLEQAERKVSASKLKKGVISFLVLLVLAGAGYGAFRVVSGEVVGSRFSVTKMNCPACVITVQEVTGKLPGVVGTKVSLAAMEVTVQYREKQTSADQIRDAIAAAGYPARIDGSFKPGGVGITQAVVAAVNGKPVFETDLKIPFSVVDKGAKASDVASGFFSVVGKEILLQAADKETIVIQPFEVEEEVNRILKDRGISQEQLLEWIKSNYGSPEKYYQLVGQRLGIRRFVDEHVLLGVKDPEEKKRKTLEIVGRLFKEADVKIFDDTCRQRLQASVGQGEWKTFWPRMIGAQTELKSLLLQ